MEKNIMTIQNSKKCALRINRMRNLKQSGYTLMEILFVITILGVLSALIVSTYYNFAKESRTQRISIQQSREIANLQNYLRKIIGSIGFGIRADYLKEAQNLNCNNSQSFISQNASIGLASNCTTEGTKYDELYFRSLYADGDKLAGCWWVVIQRERVSMAVDKLGQDCVLPSNASCTVLGSNKEFMNIMQCNDPNPCGGETLCYLFYGPDQPNKSAFRLYLSAYGSDSGDSAQKRKCAPGAAKLMLQQYDGTSQPFFDCVGGMKFQIEKTSHKIQGLWVCLLVQESGKMSTPIEVPIESACGNFEVREAWSFYRWRIIEEYIPLKNL